MPNQLYPVQEIQEMSLDEVGMVDGGVWFLPLLACAGALPVQHVELS